ncbi:hypothetical protein PG994_013836 [Apiospora phragmitis]|uniref:Uncharacterized protein n=1 Tax=Apiospora phragmitis TaxID=2905665 RepID=A0ABR1T2M6_9PEZI
MAESQWAKPNPTTSGLLATQTSVANHPQRSLAAQTSVATLPQRAQAAQTGVAIPRQRAQAAQTSAAIPTQRPLAAQISVAIPPQRAQAAQTSVAKRAIQSSSGPGSDLTVVEPKTKKPRVTEPVGSINLPSLGLPPVHPGACVSCEVKLPCDVKVSECVAPYMVILGKFLGVFIHVSEGQNSVQIKAHQLRGDQGMGKEILDLNNEFRVRRAYNIFLGWTADMYQNGKAKNLAKFVQDVLAADASDMVTQSKRLSESINCKVNMQSQVAPPDEYPENSHFFTPRHGSAAEQRQNQAARQPVEEVAPVRPNPPAGQTLLPHQRKQLPAMTQDARHGISRRYSIVSGLPFIRSLDDEDESNKTKPAKDDLITAIEEAKKESMGAKVTWGKPTKGEGEEATEEAESTDVTPAKGEGEEATEEVSISEVGVKSG